MAIWNRLTKHITIYGIIIGIIAGAAIQIFLRFGFGDTPGVVPIISGMISGGIYGMYLGIITRRFSKIIVGVLLGMIVGSIGGEVGNIMLRFYFMMSTWIIGSIVRWVSDNGLETTIVEAIGAGLGGAFVGGAVGGIDIVIMKMVNNSPTKLKPILRRAFLWIIIYATIGLIISIGAKPTFCGDSPDICGYLR